MAGLLTRQDFGPRRHTPISPRRKKSRADRVDPSCLVLLIGPATIRCCQYSRLLFGVPERLEVQVLLPARPLCGCA